MMTIKKWMKTLSRALILNMVWMTGPAAWAEPAHATSLANPETGPRTGRSQEMSQAAVPADFRESLADGGLVHNAVLEAVQNYPQGGNRQFPANNTIFANAGNFGGFIITYSTVLAGFLVLYVPLGSYGAAKCVFDQDGWNDCWNAYMIRTFH